MTEFFYKLRTLFVLCMVKLNLRTDWVNRRFHEYVLDKYSLKYGADVLGLMSIMSITSHSCQECWDLFAINEETGEKEYLFLSVCEDSELRDWYKEDIHGWRFSIGAFDAPEHIPLGYMDCLGYPTYGEEGEPEEWVLLKRCVSKSREIINASR